MASELLVEYIKDGGKLVKFLDKNHQFKVTAALWYYISESAKWRLLIGSPYVGKHGDRKSYELIQSIMNKSLKDSKISLDMISPMKSKDPFFNLLRPFIHCEGICGIRVTNSQINDFLLEDAYIYRNI
jgi:hypothetical protein